MERIDDPSLDPKYRVLLLICEDYNKAIPAGVISPDRLKMKDDVFTWSIRKLLNEELVHIFKDPPWDMFQRSNGPNVGMTYGYLFPTNAGLELANELLKVRTYKAVKS